MNNYYVHIVRFGGLLVNQWEKVEGEPVMIEGFEELDLFLHHPFELKVKDIWMISEGKTGGAVTGWATTPEEAKRFAKDVLEIRGLEAVRIALEKNCKKGTSPRYEVSGQKECV